MPGFRPLTYADSAETRVYVSSSKCTGSGTKEFAPLVVAFAASAASRLLDNFGTALSDAAKGGQLPASVASANFQVVPETVPSCIIAVRGRFFQKGSENALAIEKPSSDIDLPPIYDLDHLIELQVLSSSNGAGLTFSPVYLRVDKSINGDKSGTRDLTISLKFTRLGADSVGSVVLISGVQVGEARPPLKMVGNRFEIEAQWFASFHAAGSAALLKTTSQTDSTTKKTVGQKAPGQSGTIAHIPAPSADGGSAGAGAGGGSGATSPSIPGAKSGAVDVQSTNAAAVPVTATASVVETRPERGGLAFVAAVFSDIKPKVNTAVANAIDPSAKTEADAAKKSTAFDNDATCTGILRERAGGVDCLLQAVVGGDGHGRALGSHHQVGRGPIGSTEGQK